MTTATKKRLAWWIMSAGFGATLFFGAFFAFQEALPLEGEYLYYLWPLLGMGMGCAGVGWFRRLYRIEPPAPPAAFHLALHDLIAATLLSAALAGLSQSLTDTNKAFFITLFGVLGFFFYLHGALAASLRGVSHTWRRPLFVVSHILLTLGVVGWLVFAFNLFISIFINGDWSKFSTDFVLKISRDVIRGHYTIDASIRTCILALLPGIALYCVWRHLEHRASATEITTP